MNIKFIDHFVLTVSSIETTCRFYSNVLGMNVIEFANGRKALSFGTQKINLHEVGKEFKPNAEKPTPGSADFCLVTDEPIKQILAHFHALNIEIEEGIVDRTGASGPIRSIYIRDPDHNLIEISQYV